MKTENQWFSEYSESHKNETNKIVHYICVPTIFFSFVGLLMSIPTSNLSDLFPKTQLSPLYINWAVIASVLILVLFYLRLSVKTFLIMSIAFGISIVLNYILSNYLNLLYFSITIFFIAWIGQFYGHKAEGKKPSFLKDLQFLLIGPIWIAYSIFKK